MGLPGSDMHGRQLVGFFLQGVNTRAERKSIWSCKDLRVFVVPATPMERDGWTTQSAPMLI